ncbi:cation:proton antiporter [Mycolicibacterium palauense]|uniref:cation:proton antiporter n=1 Tax=Mycolicibacterium palauense TaxID=2034511 RepID=UPI000BFEF29C|nr:cation:proton antiporter [Mycolicibacterium palauense]
MAGFGFDDLALLAVIGLAGPLLAAIPRLRVPVVVGEIAAGLVVGRTGLGIIDHTEPTFALLAEVGFALVMFVAGTHVPIRNATLRAALPRAVARAVLVGAVAAGLAVGVATLFGTGHALLYAVLMASSSAALAMPVINDVGLGGPPVISLTAQIAVADTASIVLVPLVIDPHRAPRAALGALAVAGGALVFYLALRIFDRRRLRRRMHKYSERRRFALELRLSLLVLFALAALAVSTHVSIMLAGFALGLVVSAVGEPRRLARQLFGITEGFFAPLFFVWLGASLQVRELAERPQFALLGVVLGVGAVAAHLAGTALGQPPVLAVLAAAQTGVPIAAATLGTQQGLLGAGEPSALIVGALITVVVTSAAARLAVRRYREPAVGPPTPDTAPG